VIPIRAPADLIAVVANDGVSARWSGKSQVATGFVVERSVVDAAGAPTVQARPSEWARQSSWAGQLGSSAPRSERSYRVSDSAYSRSRLTLQASLQCSLWRSDLSGAASGGLPCVAGGRNWPRALGLPPFRGHLPSLSRHDGGRPAPLSWTPPIPLPS
jgi:hypothetical protein